MSLFQIPYFGGIYPAIEPEKLPDHAAQVAHNCTFRSLALEGIPRRAQVATVSRRAQSMAPTGAEPFGGQFKTYEMPTEWFYDRRRERHIVFGGEYPIWYSTSSNREFRLGFVKGRTWNGNTAPYTASRTLGDGTDGLEYFFFVELEGPDGDVSDLYFVEEGVLLAAENTAAINVSPPDLHPKENVAFLNLYASTGGDSPTKKKYSSPSVPSPSVLLAV